MKKFLSLVILLTVLFSALPAFAQDAAFDPGNIISDAEILDSRAMTQAEIQSFLAGRNSFLANYQVTDPSGNTMLASQAIYDRAVTNGISPKFIIVLIQKEQSLIDSANPSQSRLDWAAGYGCPDGGGCNDRWRGFWKQINSASLQFRDYVDNPRSYKYQVGQTYTFTNPYSTTFQGDVVVTIANRATAGLYNYTPHVYNGNYNFWNLWKRYFSKGYLNGSVVQAQGDAGVWLIENGMKRPFVTKSAFLSRYDPSRIQVVSKSDLDAYPKGDPIKFPLYSIIRVPDGKIYLLAEAGKRKFANMEAFRKMGFNPEEVINAQASELASYPDAQQITVASLYPTGALLQDKKSGGVYWVDNGVKAPIWDGVLLKTRFKGKKVIGATAAELAAYPTTAPVKLKDGDLVRSSFNPAVYVIENGLKRPFLAATTFERLGYKWTNVITVSPKLLALHADGAPVTLNP